MTPKLLAVWAMTFVLSACCFRCAPEQKSYVDVPATLDAVKKRGGAHERDIREFRLEPGRVSIGPSLREFRGVLTGVPFLEEASVARG